MERNQVLEEYRKLCNLLNQGNKLASERTEIRFSIESVRPSEFRLVLALINSQENRKIELARSMKNRDWERSGLTKFKKLELFCANFLIEHEELKDLKLLFQNHTREEIVISLAIDLQKIFDDWMIDYRF